MDARSRGPVARRTAQITSSGNASFAVRRRFGSVVATLTSAIPATVSRAGDGIKSGSKIRLTFLLVPVLASAALRAITLHPSPSSVWGVQCARPTQTSSACECPALGGVAAKSSPSSGGGVFVVGGVNFGLSRSTSSRVSGLWRSRRPARRTEEDPFWKMSVICLKMKHSAGYSASVLAKL